MIGVNIYSIDKYIQILLNANYTIVLISQTSEAPFVKREVTNIYSPGTNIEYSIKGDTNNLVGIYIEEINNQKTNKNILLSAHQALTYQQEITLFLRHILQLMIKILHIDELFKIYQSL